MAPTTFTALKDKRDPLVVSALDYLVLLHKWQAGCPYMPTDLTDSAGVLQELPPGWFTSGEIQKSAGVNLTPDTQTSNIEGYGSANPRRTIVTNENFTVDYYAQEWRKQNLEMYYSTDLTTTTASPGKGFKASKTSQLQLQYYSALIIAYDGMPTKELYPWWAYGKVAVTRRQAKQGQQGSELGMPLTLTLFEDSEWGQLFDFGIAGAGFDDIAADAGFLSAATAITVNPATADLLTGELLQLTVIDDNGFDRTSECTFSSGDELVASVSSTGLVTAEGAGGPATVTATLDALTDDCSVTVT